MATICVTVFTLPHQLAAITTPSLAATIRMPDTMNSRAMIMRATHDGRTCCSTSTSNAAVTSSLSASGSMNFPRVVTSLRLRAK